MTEAQIITALFAGPFMALCVAWIAGLMYLNRVEKSK
jgi:hypothetical protein